MEKGYKQQNFGVPVRRYVQTLQLRDDPQLMTLYRKWHSEEHIWKETLQAIRNVGILEMEIYIHGTTLVMIVDAPENLDWDQAMADMARQPRQAEWEAFVATFQGCAAEARSDEKWQMMERMFHLYNK